MKKMKIAVLFSILCMFIGGFAHGQFIVGPEQPTIPIVVTRSDVNGTFAGPITVSMRKPMGMFTTGLGTQSISNGYVKSFTGPTASIISFSVSDGTTTSSFLPLPMDMNENAQDVVFNYGSYTIHIMLWRTGTNAFTLSAVKAVPVW